MKENLQRSLKETEESREEFRKLADFVPQIVWTATAEGFTDYYNEKWYEYTGSDKIYGDQSFTAFMHPDDVQNCIESWHKAVNASGPYEMEYRFRNREGQYRWFLGRGVPVKNSEGEIVKWFGTCTDIHDRKSRSEQLEQLVQERTQELERSNDDLRQFAHVASHDLKEPIRKIRMFSSRLKEDYSTAIPEEGKLYIEKIQEAAKRMAAMIDGVLNYSVTSNGEQSFETIDLNEIMYEIKQDLELVIQQKNATVTYQDLPKIRGIRVLIYQLFYNLLNNALKFSRENQQNNITIKVKKVKGSEINGSTNLVPGKDYISIEINDQGIGFDPAQAEKMFQLFSRLNPKDKYEGTGLGLALCKKIALRHNGNIIAKGKENEGASFNVLLPA
jgi:PAS domain S-box-containing protein